MSEVTLEERAHALENEYFRRRERELIEKMRARLAAEQRASTQRACPKCEGGMLVETDYENIKMDVCNNCHGVWLDVGELARILHKDEDKGWFGRYFG